MIAVDHAAAMRKYGADHFALVKADRTSAALLGTLPLMPRFVPSACVPSSSGS